MMTSRIAITIILSMVLGACSLTRRSDFPQQNQDQKTVSQMLQDQPNSETLDVAPKNLPSGIYAPYANGCRYRISSNHVDSDQLDWFVIHFMQPCSYQGNYRMNCSTVAATASAPTTTCKPASEFPALDIVIKLDSSTSFVETNQRNGEQFTYSLKQEPLSSR